MKYQIKFSEYHISELEDQVAHALEKMVEQKYRAAAPAVWNLIDKVNRIPKASDEVLKKRTFRRKIYGVILIALGVFLFVPSVMDWRNMIVPLVMSVCAIGLGLKCLLPRRRQENKFLSSARKLLSEKPPYDEIRFRNDDILLGTAVAISYTDITHLLETEDTYIVVLENGMAVIQKKDIPQKRDDGEEDFAQFVARLSGRIWQK